MADIFGISTREVYQLAARERAQGDLHPHTESRGRKPKLTQEQLDEVKAATGRKPDITIADLIHDLNLSIGESRLGRIVRKLGFRYKKKVIHAPEQERPDVKEKRETFHERIASMSPETSEQLSDFYCWTVLPHR